MSTISQKKCLCYPEGQCKAPPELDPEGFTHSCHSCRAKLCGICIGEEGFVDSQGILCRLCVANDAGNQVPARDVQPLPSSTPSPSSYVSYFEYCTICIRKRIDQDDTFGRKVGECRQCVEARVLRSSANAKPKKLSSVGACQRSHQGASGNYSKDRGSNQKVVASALAILDEREEVISSTPPTLIEDPATEVASAISITNYDVVLDDDPRSSPHAVVLNASASTCSILSPNHNLIMDTSTLPVRDTYSDHDSNPPVEYSLPIVEEEEREDNMNSDQEMEIRSVLAEKNKALILAFKSGQYEVTVTAPGGSGGSTSSGVRRVFTLIHPKKFSRIKKGYGKVSSKARSNALRHYYCRDYFGDQNVQRYISIEFHGYVDEFHALVPGKYKSLDDTLVLGFCGLRCSILEDEDLRFILCSSYFGNCGALKHIIYEVESQEIDVWGSLVKSEFGEKKKYFCDSTMPFELDPVLACYLKHRAGDVFNPVFDPDRYDAKHGKGKSANYIVPELVFGGVNPDALPIPSVGESNDGYITRSSVNHSSSEKGAKKQEAAAQQRTGKERLRGLESKKKNTNKSSGRAKKNSSVNSTAAKAARNCGTRSNRSSSRSSASAVRSKNKSSWDTTDLTSVNSDQHESEVEVSVSNTSRHHGDCTKQRKKLVPPPSKFAPTSAEDDDEGSSDGDYARPPSTKRGKASASAALMGLQRDIEFCNRIVEGNFKTFTAVGGGGGGSSLSSEESQFRDKWFAAVQLQQENALKQAESNTLLLQQLLLAQFGRAPMITEQQSNPIAQNPGPPATAYNTFPQPQYNFNSFPMQPQTVYANPQGNQHFCSSSGVSMQPPRQFNTYQNVMTQNYCNGNNTLTNVCAYNNSPITQQQPPNHLQCPRHQPQQPPHFGSAGPVQVMVNGEVVYQHHP